MSILVAYATKYGATRQMAERIAEQLRAAGLDVDVQPVKAIKPRDHRVFFGALNRATLRFPDSLVARLPAFPGVEADFRDWADVDAWAQSIAHELAPVRIGAQ